MERCTGAPRRARIWDAWSAGTPSRSRGIVPATARASMRSAPCSTVRPSRSSRRCRATDKEEQMPRGDKSAYTDKQKRQAEHIEEGYEESGVSEEEAERRAWATVNKMTGGGKKSGSGRGRRVNKAPARKGGRKGGAASARRPKAARSRSAKKAAATRKRRASR